MSDLSKLGRITQIIAYSLTFISVILTLLLIIFVNTDNSLYKYNSSGTAIGTVFSLLLIGLIILVIIIGKYLASFYGKHKKYINKEISLKNFEIKWYICLFLCFLCSLPTIYMLTKADSLFLFIIALIPIMLLIPQVQLLHKTNYGFINKKYYLPKTEILNNLTQSYKNKSIKSFITNLDDKERLVLCIVIALIIGLILGYRYGETHHLDIEGNRVGWNHVTARVEEFKFNYLVGVASFILSFGVSYLILNKSKK